MSERNWSYIQSGATFESLVSALVFFEDSQAALFGRRGRDGGQDVRSGDGTLVYQAKHHEQNTPAKAIQDAKKEAKKIQKYLTSGDSHKPLWDKVTHWRLVTNTGFNPMDKDRWDTEVVPEFKKLGLETDYWELENLNALLARHPELDRAYFGNQTRVFLSLPEKRDELWRDNPFVPQTIITPFVGRAQEITQIKDFLTSPEQILLAHGPGGVGKSRLAMEAGDDIAADGEWRVLWANTESMTHHGGWFEGIIPEHQTLLVVDDPDDATVLELLVEQLSSRTSKWKILVTVRSPKDPILHFLTTPKIRPRVRHLKIDTLPTTEAMQMCLNLLQNTPELMDRTDTWYTDTAETLARVYSNHPIWLTLAVHVLASTGDLATLPDSATSLAKYYVDEIIKNSNQMPAETIRELLFWVAIMGTINREDELMMEHLSTQLGFQTPQETDQALSSLVQRGVLRKRGARSRLVELKPDVLRDHIVTTQLIYDRGYGHTPVQPTARARELAQALGESLQHGGLNNIGKVILSSLIRLEAMLASSRNPVPLLDPVLESLRSGLEDMPASARITMLNHGDELARCRPEDILDLCQDLRESLAQPDTVGGHTWSQDHVVLKLAWVVYQAMTGVQEGTEYRRFLHELCMLAEEEHHIKTRHHGRLYNDGKRACQLMEQVRERFPPGHTEFERMWLNHTLCYLEQATQNPLRPEQVEVLKTLINPVLSIKRTQTYTVDNTLHIQPYFIGEDSPEWEVRQELKYQLQTLLEDHTLHQETRALLWSFFEQDHQVMRRASMYNSIPVEPQVQEDLVWALTVLRTDDTPYQDLRAARPLWEGYMDDDQETPHHEQATNLEALYIAHPLVTEFVELFDDQDFKTTNIKQEQLAHKLATQGTHAIKAFLDRAYAFLTPDSATSMLSYFAYSLGSLADTHDSVREFIFSQLEDTTYFNFAVHACTRWFHTLRQSTATQQVLTLLDQCLTTCTEPSYQIRFLYGMYGVKYRTDIAMISGDEIDKIRAQCDLFMAHHESTRFLACVGWSYFHDWPAYQTLIEHILDRLDDQDQHTRAIHTLIQAVHWTAHASCPKNSELSAWFLTIILTAHDLYTLKGNNEYYIKEIFKYAGYPELHTLLQGLTLRNARLPLNHNLEHFVRQIEADETLTTERRDHMAELIEFVIRDVGTNYCLYNLPASIDPTGQLVPDLIRDRIEIQDPPAHLPFLARIAAGYALGSGAWRKIARPILIQATMLKREDRKDIYSMLSWVGMISYSFTHGQVPERFIQAANHATVLQDQETDHAFEPFWRWYVGYTQHELNWQNEHAKEQRGD